MLWFIPLNPGSRVRLLITAGVAPRQSSASGDNSFQCSPFSGLTNSFPGFLGKRAGFSKMGLAEDNSSQSRLTPSGKRNLVLSSEASSKSLEFSQESESCGEQNVAKTDSGLDLFHEMKQRFLSFKRRKYLKEFKHFQTLAEAQSPKFMVIACADSRVCPSNILGFQPGEAFMIRNIANLVPSLEDGPSETNAALEFAVNSLRVENILVIGHSSCGGIQALMGMQDHEDSSLIGSWVMKGRAAKLRTEADSAHLSFDQQCRYCEKESINRSLLNLLTYPWIKDRARRGLLSIHGGYYDFVDCTFEKWTLDLFESAIEDRSRCLVKDETIWG